MRRQQKVLQAVPQQMQPMQQWQPQQAPSALVPQQAPSTLVPQQAPSTLVPQQAQQPMWTRHRDNEGDVWYSNDKGETVWHLPLGATCRDA